MTQTQEPNRQTLKNQALLERISSLVAQYENQVAELRVELTVTTQLASEQEERSRELVTSLTGELESLRNLGNETERGEPPEEIAESEGTNVSNVPKKR